MIIKLVRKPDFQNQAIINLQSFQNLKKAKVEQNQKYTSELNAKSTI